jgi:hypothetical protein
LFDSGGVYRTLGLPDNMPTFGDCGAWGYIKRKVPPFAAGETLEFYRRMKFTYACTIDHIILPETFSERFYRLEITLRNAKEMFDVWASDPEYYGFELVGVVQGWDPQSYYDSAKQIIEMGFNYIALGGQSRAPSKFTVDILRRCSPLWEGSNTKVHIFGLARDNLFDHFRRYRVHSFDNAYHRRAWLSLSDNYELGQDGYTAIRIPIAKNPSEMVAEKNVMERLRLYDKGMISSSNFLRTLAHYDQDRAKILSQEYERTLQERPWERCSCIICKELGIHVIIFRSNERNMRRGFHNLWNLYSSKLQTKPVRGEQVLLARN